MMNDDIKKACDVMQAGGLILYPTDTIWGIGCDATNPQAVQKVFDLKQRADNKALLVLLDSPSKLDFYVSEVPDIAWDLIEMSLEPLTIIYSQGRNLASNLISSDGSIGIRITKEEFSKSLCEHFRKPIVSTSANISGMPSPANFSEISEEITRVLVTFGGTDPLNVTPRVLHLLTTFFPTWEKTVVLGAAFSDVRTVESLADSRTKLLRNLTAGEMRDAMMTCDLAISAAGQTINELAATGLPSVVFKVAGNQTYNIAGWKKYGFIDAYLDATAEWDDSQLCDAIRSLASADVRRRMSLRGQESMDGCGPDRLAKRVLRLFAIEQLSLRPAADEDASRLFELANDALVRQNSFSTKTIAWDEHRAWFARLLADEGRRLYVFFVKNEFLGQVRFDSDGWRDAVISISLASAFRGWGLASVVLQKAVAAIRHEHAALQHINAYVKPANVASRLAFEKAGVRPAECERADSLKFIYSYA